MAKNEQIKKKPSLQPTWKQSLQHPQRNPFLTTLYMPKSLVCRAHCPLGRESSRTFQKHRMTTDDATMNPKVHSRNPKCIAQLRLNLLRQLSDGSWYGTSISAADITAPSPPPQLRYRDRTSFSLSVASASVNLWHRLWYRNLHNAIILDGTEGNINVQLKLNRKDTI